MKLTKSKLKEMINEARLALSKVQTYKDNPPFKTHKQIKKDIKEESLNEVELPAEVKRFANKFIDALKRANLNKMKQTLVLTMVVDALGIEPRSLAQYMGKVKREL